MGRQPLGDKYGMKKGNWSPDEDQVLLDYIKEHGPVNWKSISENTGLLRCGKSCRTRWKNYLDPDIKRGPFSSEEKATVIQLEGMLGNRWAAIAAQLPGRTDNDVKNFFRGHRKKRMNPGAKSLQINKCCSSSDIVNVKHESPSTQHMKQWESARVEAEARLSMESLLLNPSVSVKKEYDYFLQLWNSEVGESFRNIKGKGREANEGSTSFSQALSSTKLDSISVDNTIQATAINTAGTTHGQDSKLTANEETSSGFISSTDFPASSDIPDCNFMEYLQGETESFNDFLGL